MKISRVYVPPIQKKYETWERGGQDKAEADARHPVNLFQPNGITSELDLTQRRPLDVHREQIR